MKKEKLIEELQKLPQDAQVWSQDEIGGYNISVRLDADNEVMITSHYED